MDIASRVRFNIIRIAVLLPAIGATVGAACSPQFEEHTSKVSQAATAPALGTAATFGVLAGSTVTNVGLTVVSGSVGVSPGTAITGFPPGVVNSGTIEPGTPVAAQAQSDAVVAYNALVSEVCDQDLSGMDLGGLTLAPGTYCFATSAQLTGILTLDAQGDPSAVFVFKIGSTLTTATGAAVVAINGGNLCNAYWQIGSSATIGTGTSFGGTMLAFTSITVTTSSTVIGRALALNGAVTLDQNTINATMCEEAPDAGTDGGSSSGSCGRPGS